MDKVLALILIGLKEIPAELQKSIDAFKEAYLRNFKADDQLAKWKIELSASNAALVQAQNRLQKSIDAFDPRAIAEAKSAGLLDAPAQPVVKK